MTTQKTIRFPITLLFSLIPIAVAVGLSVQYPILPFHSTALWAVGVCFVVYAASSIIAGPPEDEQWASYISVTLTVAWLSMGITVALWVLIIGELMAIGLRALEGQRFTGETLNVRESIYRGLGRISAYGIAAISGYLIYSALGGKLPLRYISLMQVIPIIGSIGGIYFIAKGLQVFYREGQNQSGLFWKPSHWQMLFTETLLLLVAVILPLVLYKLGPFVFSALLILSVAQTYRQRQIQFIQQALVQRINELATLNTVGQSVTSQLLLDDVLNNIYTEAQKIFNFPIFYIATYNSDNDFYEYRFIGRHGRRSKPPIAPIADGLHDYLRTHRKSLLITKNQVMAMQAFGIKNWNPAYASYLGVALYVGDKFLGIMAGACETFENHFSDAERHLFEMIGTQASLAIRNAILYDRSVQMAHRLSLINQSVQDVMFNLDSEEGFLLACQTAMEVCQAQAAAIFVLDADTKTYIELAQSVGLPQEFKDFFQNRIQASELFNGQFQIVPNIKLIEDELQCKLAELGNYSAYIYKTLRSGESQLGYLVVYHRNPYYFSQLELDLLETLTTQISSALDNAELLKSLEQYSSEQAQLVHLSKITSSSLELEKVATSIIDLLSQMMQVSSVMLGLTSQGRRRLQIFGDNHNHYADSHIYNMAVSEIPEFEEILEKAASTTPIVYHYHETISPQLAEWMQERQAQRILIVPMVTKDEVIGLILLLETEPRRFRDVDWRLLETAANQITAQVQNAQIYTYTEGALLERLHQLALIEEIAQNISRELDLDHIILNVLDAAIRTTHADLASLALVQPGNTLKVIGRRIIN
ncbi:MAG: GAF domain-containing protein, partial [Chloroflexi bacterium]